MVMVLLLEMGVEHMAVCPRNPIALYYMVPLKQKLPP
jgi:hypothetical protein